MSKVGSLLKARGVRYAHSVAEGATGHEMKRPARHRESYMSPSSEEAINFKLCLTNEQVNVANYSSIPNHYLKDIRRCHGSSAEPWLRSPGSSEGHMFEAKALKVPLLWY